MDQIIPSENHTQKFHEQVHVLLIRKLQFQGIRPSLLTASISLVSISLAASCCYYYCNNYSCRPLLPFTCHNFFYLSTIIFSLITHSLERKYMFLLCNGILAILLKSICLNSDPDPHPHLAVIEIEASATSDGIEMPDVIEDVSVEKEEENAAVELAAGEKEDDGDREMVYSSCTEVDERGSETLAMENDEGGEEEGEEEEKEVDGLFGNEETAAADAVTANSDDISSNEELMGTEELNKKIEEFIRKMKEEIRIEEQSQLIAV